MESTPEEDILSGNEIKQVPLVGADNFHLVHDELIQRILQFLSWGDLCAVRCTSMRWWLLGADEMLQRKVHCTQPMKKVKVFEGHEGNVLALHGWGDVLASSSSDGTIRLWSRAGTCINVLTGHSDSVMALTLWGDLLVSGSMDHTIKLWDKTGECVQTLSGPEGGIYCLCVWNGWLCSGAWNDKVWVWGREWMGSREYMKLGEENWITGLTVWGGNLVSVGGLSHQIQVWNTEGANILSLKGHQHPIKSITVWFDCVCSGCIKGDIRIWNKEGQCVHVFHSWKTNWIMSLCSWGPKLVCGGICVARVLDIKGEVIQEIREHGDAVTALYVWGQKLYIGSADGTISGWW